MAEVKDTTPDRQAYGFDNETEYKGRFVNSIANIRMLKSNPYISHLPEAEMLELNKTLLMPYDGELCYDDDMFLYICKITKDPLTGAQKYNYISKAKDDYDMLKKYEQTGVQNQLMSAYNNGRVYKFYVDRANLMMYPDTSIVFPEEYKFYTVRKQELNKNNEYIYVAGVIEDGELADTHIAMKSVNDVANGTVYTRMGAACVFEIENPSDETRFDQIINGEFYVVEFYNKDGYIVDTKLFQAQNALITDTSIPSQSVTALRVSVLRQGIVQDSANGIYPTLSGENIDMTVAFSVRAIYNDGTVKDITDKLDTPQLSRSWDVEPTDTAVVGTQFKCTFSYYPNLDENRDYIGNSVEAQVVFQVVENVTDKVYKIIPVIWNTTISNYAGEGIATAKVFKLKVYKLSNTGVLSNVTRAFYNTFKVFDDTKFVDFDKCSFAYDPYEQCVTFVWNSGETSYRSLFQFQLWSSGVQESYQFYAIFGSNVDSMNGIYIKALTGSSQYGYETDGPLSTLGETYGTRAGTELLANTIKLSMANNNYQFGLTSYTTEEFSTRYKRKINGTTEKANSVQLYSVKDDTETPISRIYTFSPSDNSIVIPAIANDSMVETLISNLRNYDWILAKYYYTSNTGSALLNYDVYAVNKSF